MQSTCLLACVTALAPGVAFFLIPLLQLAWETSTFPHPLFCQPQLVSLSSGLSTWVAGTPQGFCGMALILDKHGKGDTCFGHRCGLHICEVLMGFLGPELELFPVRQLFLSQLAACSILDEPLTFLLALMEEIMWGLESGVPSRFRIRQPPKSWACSHFCVFLYMVNSLAMGPSVNPLEKYMLQEN